VVSLNSGVDGLPLMMDQGKNPLHHYWPDLRLNKECLCV